MKKMPPIAAVAALAMMFASCKKDYTCTCTITTPGATAETIALPVLKTTKSKAKDVCNAAQTTYTTAGSTASCKI